MKKYMVLLLIFSQITFAFEVPQTIQGKDLVSGKNISIDLQEKDFTGSAVIFLSSHCPCSQSHTDEIKKLSQDFKKIKFVAINSNMDEDVDVAKKYFSETGFAFPVVRDEKAKYANQFKALKTPHAFLMNARGEILYSGGVTSSSQASQAEHLYLREALNDFSAGRDIKVKSGRTLGCMISR